MYQQDPIAIDNGRIWVLLSLAFVGEVFQALRRVDATVGKRNIHLKLYVSATPSSGDRVALQKIQKRIEETLRGFDIKFAVLEQGAFDFHDGFGTVFSRRGFLK